MHSYNFVACEKATFLIALFVSVCPSVLLMLVVVVVAAVPFSVVIHLGSSISLSVAVTSPALINHLHVASRPQFNPLALLSGTLRTYQRTGCDDQLVTLKCPHGTSISVDVAQYGRAAPGVCPSMPTAATASNSVPSANNNYTTCLWPTALQVGTIKHTLFK